jgi:hypothetical protein
MPRRKRSEVQPGGGLPKKSGRHPSASSKRKLPEALYLAWSDHLGRPGSDMEAAASASLWEAFEGTAKTESATGFISHLREEWLKKSLQALRTDPDFFRRLANLLEAERREPREDGWFYCAVMAYAKLYEDPSVDPETITKQQVEELANRWRAFWRLSRAGKIDGPFKDNFGEEQEALLAREIIGVRQHQPRWQGIWKHPVFSALKDARRGRKPKNVD